MAREQNNTGKPLRLRVHQVETHEVTLLNLAISATASSKVQAFYVERLAEDNCAFTVELQDAALVEPTVSVLQQVIDDKRIEIVSGQTAGFDL